MARPKKQTVDYFPHYVNTSKTLSIIQSQYGNDGYAFWFKILELLGRTEGHIYDYNNDVLWLYLITSTHVSEAKARQILESFATLGMIDKESWEKKIIWVQHFVDEHAALYARRKVGLPQRPNSSPPESAFSLTQFTEHDTFKDDSKVATMIKYYEDELGRTLTPANFEKLKDFADNYSDGWFEKAVDEAKRHEAKSPMKYIEKIMENWFKEDKPPETSTDNQGIETI